MRYIKIFEDFKPSESVRRWESNFPKTDKTWKAPDQELYRWLNPELVEIYLSDKDMVPAEESYYDDEGGIPFFTSNDKYFGFVEPYVRIILDKSKLLDDGYTLFDPHRDPGEMRIKEAIKDWKKYLIAFEVNRNEFDLKGTSGEDIREIPIPFNERKSQWKLITDNVPAGKIKIVDDDYFSANVF